MYPSFIFIRHGEGESNQKSNSLKKGDGLMSKLEVERQLSKVSLGQQYMDNQLTEVGRKQATEARNNLNLQHIDTVIVSPLRRALETCDIIFGNQKHIKFYVQPLMGQKLSHAANIGSKIKQSRQIYGKKYDFSRIPQDKQQRWYLDFILPQQKIKTVLQISQNQKIPLALATLRLLQKKQGESKLQLQQRSHRLKQEMIKYRQLSKKKVALVGHSSIFKAVTATGFYEDGQTINQVQFNYGQIKQVPIVVDDYYQEDQDLVPFCQFPLFKQ